MHCDNKQLRTAVVGLGRIGWQFHLPEISSNKGFQLVAVVDPLTERLTQSERAFGIKGYSDYQDMLASEKPDLVVIASPTKFHCEQAVMAFEHGCDVFCEKPVVLDLREMDVIIESQRRFGRKFMVYQPHRACSDIVCLKYIISLGLLGRIYMIKRCCSAFRRRNDWQALKTNGGGMLNNYGSHYIDQLLYLTDRPISDIKCIRRNIVSLGDAEDVVKIVMETDDDMILDVDINMASAFEMHPWQVLADNGSAVLDVNSNMWVVKYFVPDELQDVFINAGLAAKGRSYSNGETIPWRLKEFRLSDFAPIDYYQKCYEYFALDDEPFIDIDESRRLIEVIEKSRNNSIIK